MHRQPFKSSGEIHSTRKLQLVHSDMCGPMPTDSLGGKRYFVFTDDFSRCSQIYLMKHMSEALNKFKEFKAMVKNETGLSICTLRTDNGGNMSRKSFLNVRVSNMSIQYPTHLNKMVWLKGSIKH